jgi:hypothetical protein
MLVFAGNAVKILSPSPKASSEVRARANRFRREIKVPDADLKQIADARNYLEHFDERMDRFLAVPGGIVIHRFVRDYEPTELALDDRKLKPRFLQLLQTTDWYLVLHGDRVDLQKIYTTMENIGAQARMRFQKQGVPGYSSAP